MPGRFGPFKRTTAVSYRRESPALRASLGGGDIVYIRDEAGRGIACGITNYGSSDVELVQGLRSDHIQETLGYDYGQEVVHRNNLVLL